MIRKRYAVVTGAFVIWALTVPAASAFEQTPLAPAPAVPPVTAPPAAPNLSSDDQSKQSQPEDTAKKGLKIPGLGKVTVPKLNFGLDLMYGSPDTRDTELNFSNDPLSTNDDLTIMGKVKRRF